MPPDLMLKLIRKYQYTLMLFVAVIVILAFSVWSGYTGGAAPGSATLLRVYGRDYPRDEYQRLLQSRELAEMLGQFQFTTILANLDPRFGDPTGRNTIDYIVNLLVLREEAPKLGIEITDDEVTEWVQSLPVFQGENGFDPSRARQVVQNLGAYGMGERDINRLAADVISLNRLTELVGGNISAAPTLVDSWYAVRNQMIQASVILLPFESFEEEVEVTDEDIELAFESASGQFQRPEQRALRYVRMVPPEEAEDAPEEELRQRRNQFSTRVHELAVEILDDPDNFAGILNEAGYEVVSTEPFARESPPEDLEGESEMLRAAFALVYPEVVIGDPVRASDGGFFLFEVTDRVPPEPQELDEVRDEVRELVRERELRETTRDGALDLRDELQQKLEAGQDREELLAGLDHEVLETGYFSQQEPPQEIPENLASRVAAEAPYLTVGEVSEPLAMEEGLALALVHYKELWQSPDSVQEQSWIGQQLALGQSRTILNAWFQQAKDEAQPVPSEFLVGPPPGPPQPAN